MSDEELKRDILAVLRDASEPLKAREIARRLTVRYGHKDVDKYRVNTLLFNSLVGSASKDDEHRWTLAREPAQAVPPPPEIIPEQPAESIPSIPGKSEVNGPPKCPECERPMVMRTARKGRNAGSQFWGCSAFPKCKGTRPLEDTGDGPAEAPPNSAMVRRSEVPRRVSLASSAANRQTILLEGIAAPRQAVAAIARRPLPLPVQRSLCQWKLELPFDPNSCSLPTPAVWLAVADKLLKRGRIIPLPPTLEARLFDQSTNAQPILDEDWIEAFRGVAALDHRACSRVEGFDSREERKFFLETLPSMGAAVQGWVNRQVSLGGLTGMDADAASQQRIDFLFAHPEKGCVVVEVDGAQHAQQQDLDNQRDAALTAAGYEVARIPAAGLWQDDAPALAQLTTRLQVSSVSMLATATAHSVLLAKRAHQLQLTLLKAVTNGLLPTTGQTIRVHVCADSLGPGVLSDIHAEATLEDLNMLIVDLAMLYDESNRTIAFSLTSLEEADICVDFTGTLDPNGRLVASVYDTYLPVTLSSEAVQSPPALAKHVRKDTIERFLERVFGWKTAKEGQFEAIDRALRGQDSILLLPTGAGKSVAFQLASLLRPGVCIVIDPIVSLIEDQIENLALAGIDRTTQIIHAMGGAEREKVLLVLARNEYQFCYVAPERFQDKHFRDTLRVLTTVTAISLVTVDEAHCVSEWGHDFRPAYLNIARTSREYCSSQGVRPPLMALTGTASRAVLKDVQRELQIDDFEAIITPTSFDRPELHFSTIPCHSSEKQLRIRGSLEGLPRTFGQTASRFFQPLGNNTMSGLVFCPHVNGSFGVLSVAQEMGNQLGLKVPFYSGKAPKGYGADSWHSVQHHTASEFKANAFPVMVCTKAFGMGIDKPNIRYTVHYTLPPSIESFYQEAGRAGRDRRPSHCSIIVSHDYPERSRRLLNPSTPLELIHEELAETGWKQDDDITRCLYFHRKAFRGIEADHQQVLALIRAVGNIGSPGTATVDFDDDSKTPTERAIHRLLTLGIVTDYTVSYGPKQFGVTFSGIGKDGIVECLRRYVAAYQRGQAQIVVDRVNKYLHREYYEFVIEITLELVRFVYDVIERSRRQALSEILALCTSCHTDSEIRERILRYLGSSVFSEAIETLLEEPDAGLSRIGDMLDEVKSPIDAGHLRGESGRALEAYPDHAGLRLLRAAAEALAKNPDEQRIRDDVQAAATFAASRYGLPHDTICGAVLSVAIGVAESFPALGRAIISGLFAGIGDKRLAARHILAAAPRSLHEEPLAVLLSQMNDNLVALLER